MKVARVLAGHGAAVAQVAFGPTGALLASVAGESEVLLWDVEAGALALKLTTPVAPAAIAWDGGQIFSGSDAKLAGALRNGKTYVWATG